ncbi:MAG: hypothetical protein JO212_16850 [Acetobacteraceae bacterium]|nr:hypothetical protein [Acetobacteraceae bacterium]
MLTLRTPGPDEAAALGELCLRSKAVWGYDAQFMEACRDELTITPDMLHSSYLQVVENDGCVIGVAQVMLETDFAELSKLFVEPTRFALWCRTAALRMGSENGTSGRSH